MKRLLTSKDLTAFFAAILWTPLMFSLYCNQIVFLSRSYYFSVPIERACQALVFLSALARDCEVLFAPDCCPEKSRLFQ